MRIDYMEEHKQPFVWGADIVTLSNISTRQFLPMTYTDIYVPNGKNADIA